jgi:hypothetical protein
VDKNPPAPAAAFPAKTAEELTALVRRAEKGDAASLKQLRQVLEGTPLMDTLGDLGRQTQATVIEKFAGSNAVWKEILPRKLESLRRELAGPNPTPLERLLVERIVSCWLHLHNLELIYASKDSVSLELGNYFQKNIDRAQKRYLAAIKALAVVRRLALPALQVNIAQRQQVKNV